MTPDAARDRGRPQLLETTVDHDQLTEIIEAALEAIEAEVGIDGMEIPDLAQSLATAILRAQSR